jgi:hypothetical protein
METGATVFRDIHGLDGIPIWPLAPGWWYLLGLVCLLVLLIVLRHWLFYHAGWLGWRGDARRQLRELKKALPVEDPQVVAGRLSELLRRIAVVRSGRQQAAGLTGEQWLYWLKVHDKTGFDWELQGRVLLTAPYMPPATNVNRDEVGKLIRAATRWIDASRPPRKEADLPRRFRGLLSGVFNRSGVSRV